MLVRQVALSMAEAKSDHHGNLDEYELAETTLISLSCVGISSSLRRFGAFHRQVDICEDMGDLKGD